MRSSRIACFCSGSRYAGQACGTSAAAGTAVLVDEAYHHYAEGAEGGGYESVLPLVAEHPGLIVARTRAREAALVESRDPLWDQPGLSEESKAGRHYLPGTVTGVRETIVTSPIEATPQSLLRLPGPGWTPCRPATRGAARPRSAP